MRRPESRVKLFVTTGAIIVAIGVTASAAAYKDRWHKPPSNDSGSTIDLLRQNWRYVNGVTQTENTLLVTPTNAKIVNQDGTGGQPNPPVNLYGTHLNTSGDFDVTAHLSNRGNATATVRLYDKPPIIADEFRIEPAGIAVSEHGNTMSVQIWDGSKTGDVTDPQPIFSQQATLSDPNADIVISREGRDLSVQAADTTVTVRSKGGIFRSGALWFGLDSPDDSFTVDKLAAQGLGGDNLTAVNTASASANAPLGLQSRTALIRPDFKVGAAVALGPWVSDRTYATQLDQNFGSVTLENAMKPQFISPKQGIYTFQEADALIALAHKHDMSVHGHTLAFSEAEPAWMRDLPTATVADRASTTAILLDYVSHVVQHFKGQLASLDVINEPLDTDQGSSFQQNIWNKAMGPNYMVQVSKLVHSIDPSIKQYVNENGAELAGFRQDALLHLVRNINAQGGFIYGVGLQSHVYDMHTDAIRANKLNTTINRFGTAGFKVRISENDVTDDTGTTAQANQYATVFTTCLHNPNCVSYTTWGVNDNYDWFIDDDGRLQQGHDFLFNGSGATSALTALQKALR